MTKEQLDGLAWSLAGSADPNHHQYATHNGRHYRRTSYGGHVQYWIADGDKDQPQDVPERDWREVKP